MDLWNLPEVYARLVMTYLAQSIMGIILFVIFIYFSRLFHRKFLRTWSWSWLAFSFYMIGLALTCLQIAGKQNDRLITNILSQGASFLQVVFLLMGTYELISETTLKKRRVTFIAVVVIVIAIITVAAFSTETEGITQRYILIRTGFTCLGFLIAGVVVWSNPTFTKGFGQQLLALSLILFSLDQLSYFGITMSNLWGHNLNVPAFFGLLDLLIISLMGMSMVMWLLEDEREKLRKANQELDSFLYSTSHDLRAPIASILGLTYLGKVELGEEKARTYMEMIESRIKKLDLVIYDILSLSRSKKFELKIETIDFDKLLDETIMDVKFNKGAASITLDYERNPGNTFISDANQMKIVLNNLFSNAVKYHNINQPNPYIKVIFKRTNSKVEIAVEDNGQGIPTESVPRIFEMFYRATSEVEGTGLGLYIVKEALNKIKGTIFVASKFGKGSTFTIVLENA
jgi:signal transduction histidine kinase